MSTNHKFFPNLPRAEPNLRDSTAITRFMECPRKYFYSMVLGYKSDKPYPYFTFGNAYHKFREIIELRWREESDLTKCDVYILEGMERALKFFDKHHVPPPKGNKFEFMNKERIMKSCLVGAKHWKREKAEGVIKVLAVEQPFQIILPDGEVIAGRFDQVINYRGKILGRDFKTSSISGSYYVNTLNPNDQFTRYTYAENKLTGWDENDVNSKMTCEGQLIEVLFNTKTTGPTIESFPAMRTRNEVLNWLKEQEYWHKVMQLCRDTDVWPMNTKSCTYCEFRPVCKMSSESMQQSYLKHNYKHEPWDCTHSSKEDE